MEKQQHNFEYLCRVCAANTKGKHSVAECVYILKTPALKDKIEKFLYLTISENDALPKVLCKTCFRQVEATASLSKIAKHTQHVFRDFLFSTKAKPHTADVNYDPNAAEYTPMSLTSKETEKSLQQAASSFEILPPPPPATPAPATPSPATPASATLTTTATTTLLHKDEVIVNVSVTDPLTRETSQKMISCAAQKRQSLLDPRFTPKSIAQRAIPATKPTETGIESAPKKPSPSGVINFFHGGRPQQVTTFTSGGYVIGRVSTGGITATTTTTNTQASVESQHILQQKRRNLKMALSNIKAANAGQVSLLKVSQKPKPQSETLTHDDDDGLGAELPEKIIIAAAKKQKHQQQQQAQPSAEQPTQAQTSPKKHHRTETKEPSPEAPQTHSPPQAPPATTPRKSGGLPDDILLGKVIKDTDLLKLILKALQWPVTKHTMDAQMLRLRNSKFAEIMSDPNLLLDTDLTQIMGPYLAPVLLAAHAMQQQQLAAAAAAAAAAATQQPTAAKASKAVAELAQAIPYKLPAETSVQLVPAGANCEDEDKDASAVTKANAAPGKRDSRASSYPKAPPRKMRRKTRGGEANSIVISDEEEAIETAPPVFAGPSRRAGKSASNFQVDIDPSIFSQFGICSAGGGDSSNDALLALLQRQRAALSRLQRSQRRRNSVSNVITLPANGADLNFDDDDIVLMEQGQGQQLFDSQLIKTATNSTVGSSNCSNPNSLSSVSVASTIASTAMSSFPVPSQVSSPLITRPIIKRRKTVIQASPARTSINIGSQLEDSMVKTTASVTFSDSTATFDTVPDSCKSSPATSISLPPMPPLHKKPSPLSSAHTISTQVPSTVISTATQIPSKTGSDAHANTKTTGTNVTSTASVATSNPSIESVTRDSSPIKTSSKKAQTSKSALGQQLLEAIGLQKVKSCSTLLSDHNNKQQPEASSSRESVQQIRSALKRSLKQAQEQQQQQQKRKHGLLIISDADSTTKSVVKEVLVEAKTKHSASTASPAEIDIEDEIDKIALVVQKNPNELRRCVEKKEEKKLLASKIPAPASSPEMRRKPPPQLNRSRKSSSLLLDAKNVSTELNTIEEVKEDSETKLEKEKDLIKSEDTESLNHSLSFITDTSETSASKLVTPRKRGRKSKADMEALAKEREKEEKRTEIVRQLTFEKARSRSAVSARKSTSDRDWEKDSDTMSLKNESDNATSSNRPTRASKTLSRYYKGPDKPTPPRRSIPTRATRNRN